MDWIIIANLIVNEGIPVAEAIFRRWSSGQNPTQADFDEIRALGKQTATDRARLKLVAAGIPLDSEQAKLILSLVG